MVNSFVESCDYLGKLEDEELIVRIRRDQSQRARLVLIDRYLAVAREIAAQRLHGRHPIGFDLRDLQQWPARAVLQAITGYKLSRAGGPRPFPFKAYVRLVINRRITDFLRGQTRREAHVDRSHRLEEVLEHPEHWGGRAHEPGDPAHLAEVHELHARLDQAVHDLAPHLQFVYAEECAGTSLRALADKMHENLETVKSWHNELVAQLRAKLPGWRETE